MDSDERGAKPASGLRLRGQLDLPFAGSALLSGSDIRVAGWAISGAEISEVSIWTGEQLVGSAQHGGIRGDVAAAYPEYPNARLAGFEFKLRLDKIGPTELRVEIHDAAGSRLVRAIPITVVAAADIRPLEPRAKSEKRPPPARVSIERAVIDSNGLLRVEGWAASPDPLDRIEVLLGDEPLGQAEAGLRRADVAAAHPSYPNAERSGFLFRKELVRENIADKDIKVRARASGEIVREDVIAPRIAALRPLPTAADRKIWLNHEQLSLAEDGDLVVTGWAVSASGIVSLDVYLDGERLGAAKLKLHRPDVGRRFTQIPGARKAGFSFNGKSDRACLGEHLVLLRARNGGGEPLELRLPVQAAPVEADQDIPRHEIRTLFSLPGEWIDRHGEPRPRFPIQRILVLKADHIGDLLIADPAIVLLRQLFPDARLELVCGTWNVGLAKRLGRFDAIHGIDLFHPLSGEQIKEPVAEEARRNGAEQLTALALGPFDLAVDLRYDTDTRALLRNVDARVYAGLGSFSEFPFLDIIVPTHQAESADNDSEVARLANDFGYKEQGAAPLTATTIMGGEISPKLAGRTAAAVAPGEPGRLSLASRSFELAPGHYNGLLRLYVPRARQRSAEIELAVRELTGSARLMRHSWRLEPTARGMLSLPFACALETDEPLRFEFDTSDGDVLTGACIEEISLIAKERFKTDIPLAHSGEWLRLLVLRIAQTFSDEPPFGRGAPRLARQLSEPPPGEEIPPALRQIRDRLERWRDEGHALVGVAIGCNSAIRKWPFPYFVDLVRGLLGLGRVQVVFFGAPADQEEATRACDQLKLDAAEHALCGAARLEELGLLLSKLDLFIGANTGTTHFAGTVGVRTIGVYAGTNHPREWGPMGENASWIYRDEPCAPCHLSELEKCRHGHSCMVQLRPADVLALAVPELQAIMSRGKPVAGTAAGWQ